MSRGVRRQAFGSALTRPIATAPSSCAARPGAGRPVPAAWVMLIGKNVSAVCGRQRSRLLVAGGGGGRGPPWYSRLSKRRMLVSTSATPHQVGARARIGCSAGMGERAQVVVVGSGSGGRWSRAGSWTRERASCLEAGGADLNPAIQDPGRLFELWDSEQDWGTGRCHRRLAGRELPGRAARCWAGRAR